MTTAAIETVPRDLTAARDRLAEMRRWIDEADDPALLGQAVRTLYEVREWARIRKVAGNLRAEAARLEAIALRRLGEMGPEERKGAGLNNNQVAAANGFASLTDAEFQRLLDETDSLGSPISIWNTVARKRAAEARRLEGRAFAEDPDVRGGPFSREDLSTRNIAEAARTILTAAVADGDPFAVGSAADSLVEWIGDEHARRGLGEPWSDLIDDPDFRTGMAEVVRRAVDAESQRRSRGRIPGFVSYYDGNSGWVRVPWESATLDELRQMADYRREQAERLAEIADDLERLVAGLERVSSAQDGERRLRLLAFSEAADR